MKDGEKARDLAIKSTRDIDDKGNEVYNAFVEAALQEMAAWKQDQLIDNTYRLLVEKYFFTEDEAKKFIEDLKAMLQ